MSETSYRVVDHRWLAEYEITHILCRSRLKFRDMTTLDSIFNSNDWFLGCDSPKKTYACHRNIGSQVGCMDCLESYTKKGGIYSVPEKVSSGARDLIARMLEVDPMKRITISEIRRHPWFRDHIPRYLVVPPPDTTELAKKIEDEILEKAISLGFNRNELVDSLYNLQQNEGTVRYYLLLDKRWFRAYRGYLGCEFQEIMDSGFNNPIYHHPSTQVAAPTPTIHDDHPYGSSVEKNWTVGFQCSGDRGEIMKEVVNAMKELNVLWKKINIGPYNLKCKWTPSESNVVLKFEIRLYKVDGENYLLDRQKLEGPEFVFLELCFTLMGQLKVN